MRLLVLLITILTIMLPGTSRAEAPRVVASILPLHSLASAVMKGVGEPELLVKGVGSPHSYALHPADMSAILGADVLLYISPSFETFMARPLEQVKKEDERKLLEVAALKGLKRLDTRDEHLEEHNHHHAVEDMHYWLDPTNAILVVQALAEKLAARDSANADAYRKNAAAYIESLKALDAEVASTTKNFGQGHYVVFHDAYQYFEKRYGLKPAAAITLEPGRGTSAKHVAAIRKQVREEKASCLFTEPQFDPKTAQSMATDINLRLLQLDPLGSALPKGEKLYPLIIRSLAAGFESCFTPAVDKNNE